MGRVVNDDGEREIYEEDQTEADFIRDMIEDNGKVHIVIAMNVRPGSMVFSALIEYHWYPPSEPALNDQFEVRNRTWEDIPFSVISFPRERYPDAQGVAAQLGLRIADGVPTPVSTDPNDPIVVRFGKRDVLRGKYFPGGLLPNGENNRRMFTLESNVRKKFDTTLSGDEIFTRECQLIDKFAEGVMLRPREAAQFIFGVGDFADERKVRFVLTMTREELARLLRLGYGCR